MFLNPTALKKTIPKSRDPTDWQSKTNFPCNIDLQQDSANEMWLRMIEVTGQLPLDDGMFPHLFLSKHPQKVQAVVSVENNAVDELVASADRTLEIMRTFNTEVFSVKEKPLLRWISYIFQQRYKDELFYLFIEHC